MGAVADVLAFEDGQVKVDFGGGDVSKAEHFADAGDDSQPLPGDSAAVEDSSGTGVGQATGYHDASEKKAGPGEKRIYSRSADGTPVAEFWLKNDGSVVLTGLLATPPGGVIEMAADGTVTINGVVISPLGAVSAPGQVTAMANTTPVGLGTHLHPTGMGPSGPPTAGT